MRTPLERRLGSIERTFGVGAAIKQIPHPLDVISPEERALILGAKEAWDRGEPLDTPEVHAARRRYLRAGSSYDQMWRKAGVRLRPIAETIREGRFKRHQAAPVEAFSVDANGVVHGV